MKIGIIGSGNIGGTLGKRWAGNGHEVVFSSRQPSSDAMRELTAAAGSNSRAATIADTVASCDTLLFSVPWPTAQEVLKGCGDLTGKILMDATNPVLPTLDGLATEKTTSAGEQIALWSPGVKVVKVFNTVGGNIMENNDFPAGKVALFYCGDDGEAKAVVHGLVAELGFEALDAGPLAQARLLESFALLWITLALKYGYSREIAFQFLRRS